MNDEQGSISLSLVLNTNLVPCFPWVYVAVESRGIEDDGLICPLLDDNDGTRDEEEGHDEQGNDSDTPVEVAEDAGHQEGDRQCQVEYRPEVDDGVRIIGQHARPL